MDDEQETPETTPAAPARKKPGRKPGPQGKREPRAAPKAAPHSVRTVTMAPAEWGANLTRVVVTMDLPLAYAIELVKAASDIETRYVESEPPGGAQANPFPGVAKAPQPATRWVEKDKQAG